MDALYWYISVSTMRRKNSGGHTRYPENHWDLFFVSPKCGKRMGLTGFPNSNPRGLNLK
jgi:hypothetical protein